MIGNMISKIRKDKHITKVELSKRTGINIGHLTHIEKGERNPSHKTLRLICDALEVPYQSLALMYDKDLPKEHLEYLDFVYVKICDYVKRLKNAINFIK